MQTEVAMQHTGSAFVHVSTGKAVSLETVLGCSKRIAERLVAWHGLRHPTSVANVRLGNVLGSRGSVLETFVAHACAGTPLPVTEPQMSRYFVRLTPLAPENLSDLDLVDDQELPATMLAMCGARGQARRSYRARA